MPAYAKQCSFVRFFRPAQRFKARYATFGLSDRASLDEGDTWPTDFALKRFGAAQARIGTLVRKAVR
jgi:hypothetical protein